MSKNQLVSFKEVIYSWGLTRLGGEAASPVSPLKLSPSWHWFLPPFCPSSSPSPHSFCFCFNRKSHPVEATGPESQPHGAALAPVGSGFALGWGGNGGHRHTLVASEH